MSSFVLESFNGSYRVEENRVEENRLFSQVGHNLGNCLTQKKKKEREFDLEVWFEEQSF